MTMKPRIGPSMRKALTFIREYADCGGWCSFDQHRDTRKPVERLQAIGLVEINQFGQYRTITRAKADIAHTLDNDDAVRPQSRTGTER